MAIAVEACLAALDVGAPTRTKLADLLSPDERARACAFHSEQHRSRYIVRRGRLRELLAQRLGKKPQAIDLTNNAFGKPSLVDGPLCFNLSHSRATALYVMARGVEVGCDIEWRLPELASRRVADWLFSAGERAALDSLQGDAWLEGFFNCWTRKEAVLKGRGRGLSQPFDFDVSLRPGEPATILRGAGGWSLRALEPMPGLHAAIAVQAEDWQLLSSC
ncbi:MAG: 4'-phosphopantetheinyl transferase superfamily protein [Alphaproteobacteria bacterium]|nr:4'-phosphopantetheinyl transferase superfamily protein [Alphaproteobacteria bacterium]